MSAIPGRVGLTAAVVKPVGARNVVLAVAVLSIYARTSVIDCVVMLHALTIVVPDSPSRLFAGSRTRAY